MINLSIFFKSMTFISIMIDVMVKKIKFIGFFCLCHSMKDRYYKNSFSLIEVNTSTLVVVKCVVMTLEKMSQSQLDHLVFLLDTLRLLGNEGVLVWSHTLLSLKYDFSLLILRREEFN